MKIVIWKERNELQRKGKNDFPAQERENGTSRKIDHKKGAHHVNMHVLMRWKESNGIFDETNKKDTVGSSVYIYYYVLRNDSVGVTFSEFHRKLHFHQRCTILFCNEIFDKSCGNIPYPYWECALLRQQKAQLEQVSVLLSTWTLYLLSLVVWIEKGS